MKKAQELYSSLTGIYNEACDGIAELMRNHNCDCLNLQAYEERYDFYIPMVSVYDDATDSFSSGRPTEIRLVPGHIEFSFDYYAEGGYLAYSNETDLNACEALEIYNLVESIFQAVDEGIIEILQALFDQD